MTEHIFRELVAELRGHLHHQRYHQPNTTAPEAPVSLFDTIKAEFAAIGHDLSAEGQAILHKHLGIANVAAHVANEVAALHATVTKYAREIATDLGALTGQPAVAGPNLQAGGEPEPVPSA